MIRYLYATRSSGEAGVFSGPMTKVLLFSLIRRLSFVLFGDHAELPDALYINM
jgi:hypothetical protein